MNFAPLTDSLRIEKAERAECNHCGTTVEVGRGLCLSCLLSIEAEEGELAPEDFAAALTAVVMVDTHWRLGNYEVLEEIGRGGMGVIYRARQRHSRRVVALKRVLSYHTDSRDTLARFRREAEAASSLDHPHIMPIYEVGESAEGVPYFSMKYAAGGSLRETAAALRDDPRAIVDLLAKVTWAVQFAHSQGILHRDLKPGNILLDGAGKPLVSDFGLAKWLDVESNLTRTLTIFGTPGYIAPEQAEGPAVDVKATADIYSLGAILFDLLTGRPPFLGEHALAVIRQAASQAAPKLRSLVQGADRDLETICARCLEREPQARYASAAALAEDLERWLVGRSIVARPVSPPVWAWRWVRRKPALAASVTGCVFLAMVAGLRQFQRSQLQTDVQARIASQHSVAIEPVFDLDNVRADENLATALGNDLRAALAAVGPSIVSGPVAAGALGTDSTAERSLLSATVRSFNGKRRLAFRLLSGSKHEVLLHGVVELNGRDALTRSDLRQVSARIYSLLDAPDLSASAETSRDPGLRDKRTSDLITAGAELSDRRSQVDLQRAETLLRRAVALQPRSCRAHWQLARVLSMEGVFTSDRTRLPEAEAAGRKAAELDPNNGDAHFMLAAVNCNLSRFRVALDQLQLAFECKGIFSRGTNVAAQIYDTIGRPDKSLRWHFVGESTEPHPGEDVASIGDSWTLLEADDRAQSCYEHFSELHPDKPEGWMGLARLLLFHHHPEKARLVCQQNWQNYTDFAYSEQMAAEVEFFTRHFPEAMAHYQSLYAREPDGGGRFYGAVSYRSVLGRLKMGTDEPAGRQLLDDARRDEEAFLYQAPEDPGALYRLSAIEASLGQTQVALGHLQQAFNAGWIDSRSPRLDPRFDSLWENPDFVSLLNEMATRAAVLRRNLPPSD